MDKLLEPYLIALTTTTCTAGSAALAWGTFAPGSRLWGRITTHGPRTDPPRIALTFDDGPTPGYTDQILNVLAELKVPATFFAIGANARKHPALIRQIDGAGHLIGNHSYDHPHYGFLRGPGYWRQQLHRTNEVLYDLTGKRPAFFRPPLGFKTWATLSAARRMGLRPVTWSRRGLDGVSTTPERILGRLSSRIGAGDIIALHDGIGPNGRDRPPATVAALGPLVAALRARGLRCVRLDELLDAPPRALEPLKRP
jgi:peptidoglycan-N-acetylglucosamine deacetylase